MHETKAEFPLGILGLLSAIHGETFFKTCYNPIGEMLEMLTLTNSAINFILYCLMSSQFRATGCNLWRSNETAQRLRRLSSIKLEVST